MNKTCPICQKTWWVPKCYLKRREIICCSRKCRWEFYKREREVKFGSKLGEPFADYLRRRYWADGFTLKQISEEFGELSASHLINWFKRYDIPRAPSGGLCSENERNRSRSSERMRTNNPSRIPAVREKMSRSMAKRFRTELTLCEALTLGALLARGYAPEVQMPIGAYVADFAFPTNKLILEIDGRNHDSPERKAKDITRDNWLTSQGWKIIRIRQTRATHTFIRHILDATEKALNHNQLASKRIGTKEHTHAT